MGYVNGLGATDVRRAVRPLGLRMAEGLRRRPRATAVLRTWKLKRVGRPGRPGRRAAPHPTQLGSLGFSLKPPKAIRKLQPGKILKKIAVPVAAIAATALTPGAAPLIAKGVVGAAKGVVGAAKLAAGAGRVVGRAAFGTARIGARGITKAGAAVAKMAAAKPSSSPIVAAIQQKAAETILPAPRDVAPSAAAMPAVDSPIPVPPTAPIVTPRAAMESPAGGGGGGGGGAFTADDSAPTSAPTAAGAGSMNPLVIGAMALGALVLLSSGKGRR